MANSKEYNAGHKAFSRGEDLPNGSHPSFELGFIDAQGEAEEAANEPDADAQFYALNYGQDY